MPTAEARKAPAPPPELRRLNDLMLVGYRGAKAVLAAVELGLIRVLDQTDGRASSVARRARVSERGAEILLDAVAGLGFIRKKGGRYFSTPFSRDWLHPEGRHSLAANLRTIELLSPAYAGLAAAARRGRAVLGLKALLERRPEFVSTYIGGMAGIARRPAEQLAEALDLRGVSAILDVGGGPGLFSLAMLERAPGARATILDLPETLRHTRRFVRASPFAGRVRLRPGDYRRAGFGADAFDLVLLSHVTHDESPETNAAFLRRARKALRTGGRVVIHDYMLGKDRLSPLFGALFSVHLMAYTAAGRAYSEDEYRSWLRAAGFAKPRRIELMAGSPTASVALVAGRR